MTISTLIYCAPNPESSINPNPSIRKLAAATIVRAIQVLLARESRLRYWKRSVTQRKSTRGPRADSRKETCLKPSGMNRADPALGKTARRYTTAGTRPSACYSPRYFGKSCVFISHYFGHKRYGPAVGWSRVVFFSRRNKTTVLPLSRSMATTITE